jgi:hypothetical protein
VLIEELNKNDGGMYRCVGHGRREYETLSNEVKLIVYGEINNKLTYLLIQ